jgi:hypothetical protein
MHHYRQSIDIGPLLLALLTSASASACAGAGTPPVAAAIKRAVTSQTPCKQLIARYRVGNAFHGRTWVTIKGSHVEVMHTQAGDRNKSGYQGTLASKTCRALLRTAAHGKLWAVVPKIKTGIPDETRPLIAIGIGSHQPAQVQLWDRESRNVKVFAALCRQLLAIAKRVSKGKVTY